MTAHLNSIGILLFNGGFPRCLMFCFFSFPMCPNFGRAEKLKSELISKPTRTKNQVSSQTGEVSPEGGPRACLTCIKSINTLIKVTATTYSRKKTGQWWREVCKRRRIWLSVGREDTGVLILLPKLFIHLKLNYWMQQWGGDGSSPSQVSYPYYVIPCTAIRYLACTRPVLSILKWKKLRKKIWDILNWNPETDFIRPRSPHRFKSSKA